MKTLFIDAYFLIAVVNPKDIGHEAAVSFTPTPATPLVTTEWVLVEAGLLLYRQRPDKKWSLTDCLNFAATTTLGITDALAADHHFEQAGSLPCSRPCGQPMPELPEVEIYCESLTRFYAGRAVERVSLRSAFVVRTVEPDLFAIEGRRILGFSRLGKRIVWEFEGELFLVLHLMIAGRLHRKRPGARPTGKNDLAAFYSGDADGSADTLMLTEASLKKRASIHVVAGRAGLAEHNPGGLEVLDATLEQFAARLRSENHTLKRSLASPRLFSGIGNAYSDEILHAARLSPVQLTSRLSDDEIDRLFAATRNTFAMWIERLRARTGDGFPEKVTAFHPEMAVHGRFGHPCPVCGSPVQRIRYADNETNYCARCQTGGKVLADRSLSRLLKDDWPRRIEDWEEDATP